MNEKLLTTMISGKMLKWARESAGYEIEDVEEALSKKWKSYAIGNLRNWEEDKDPGIEILEAQLYFLASKYKRPLASFFVQITPPEDETPVEFRSIGSTELFKLSPKVRFAIRKAREIQSNIADLQEQLSEEPQKDLPEISSDTDPKELAIDLRNLLSYSPDNYHNIEDAFEDVRSKLEIYNTITIKFTYHMSFPLADARAFALVDKRPFIIGINNKDTSAGKYFSLLHELGHVLMRENDITNQFCYNNPNHEISEIEVFCNAFAGNFIAQDDEIKTSFSHNAPLEEEIERLSRIFNTSMSVITRRLADLDLITKQQFKVQNEVAKEKYQDFIANKPNGGRLYPVNNAVTSFGPQTTSLITESYRNQLITPHEATQLLNLKPKYLNDLLAYTNG
jgi:Zn-dependent peptidase ImmA (M78 family)